MYRKIMVVYSSVPFDSQRDCPVLRREVDVTFCAGSAFDGTAVHVCANFACCWEPKKDVHAKIMEIVPAAANDPERA